MMMSQGLRRLALTTHVASSVGWLGAVLTFLGIAILGLISMDGPTVRGVYLVMDRAAWIVLLPFAFTSLLSGIVLTWGTSWGLLRHYWVLLKLAMTTFITVILLVYMETFREMAGVAADLSLDFPLVRNPSPVVHSVLALIVLIVTLVLAVYKPRGMTRYGWRLKHEERSL